VRYEAKKTGRSASAVKKAVKKVGNGRKRVEKRHRTFAFSGRCAAGCVKTTILPEPSRDGGLKCYRDRAIALCNTRESASTEYGF
jgi:hypothetical protein